VVISELTERNKKLAQQHATLEYELKELKKKCYSPETEYSPLPFGESLIYQRLLGIILRAASLLYVSNQTIPISKILFLDKSGTFC
jgi:hypothetical protein